MLIQMRCCHLQHKGETWTMELGEEHAEIRDATGTVRCEFSRQEAAEQFLLPSFSQSIKQFRAPVSGQLWYFDVPRDDLKRIKAYVDQSVVSAGPQAVRSVRNRALRDLLIGVGGLAVGIALTVASFLHAAQNPNAGEYVVTYGLMLFGLVMIGKGVYGHVRYSQLRKLSQTQTSGDTKA